MFQKFEIAVGAGLVVIGFYLFVFGHANSRRHNFLSSYPIIFMILAINFFDSFTAQKGKKWVDWVMIIWIAAVTFEASLFLSIFKKIGI